MTVIRRVQTRADIAEIRTLFAEYAHSLGVDLAFQNFGAELADPPGDSEPRGRLLLAVEGYDALGCVGVRPFVEQICEMKRL